MQGLTIRDHWGRRWFGLTFTGALAGAAWWFIRYRMGGTGFDGWPFFLLMAGFAILLSLFIETEINGVTNRVVRHWIFLGVVPLWCSRHTLHEFSAVQVAGVKDPEHCTQWHVQLMRMSPGRPYFVTWSDKVSEARSIAESVAQETGLPVVEEGVDGNAD